MCQFVGSLPEVQRAILREFFVDNILTGTNSIDEARILQKPLVETLNRGRFDLSKWISNESSNILDLPPEYREANENLKFLDNDHTRKARYCLATQQSSLRF